MIVCRGCSFILCSRQDKINKKLIFNFSCRNPFISVKSLLVLLIVVSRLTFELTRNRRGATTTTRTLKYILYPKKIKLVFWQRKAPEGEKNGLRKGARGEEK